MKGKVCFGVIILTLLSVVSCYHEEGPINQSGNARIDLILKSTEIQSRAINGEGNYEYANSNELEINNCFVAIFDKQSKKRLLYKEVSKGAVDPADRLIAEQRTDDSGNPATPTYKIPGIELKPGDVYIVVIANSARADLASFDTYEELTDPSVTETTLFTATFDPQNLVKTGEVEYHIESGDNVVMIPLTQLAARVDFNLKITIEPEQIDHSVDYLLTRDMVTSLLYVSSGMSTSMDYKIGTLFGNDIYGWPCDIEPAEMKHDLWYGEGNNRKNYKEEAVKKVHLNRGYFERIEQAYTYALAIEKITIENIQTKTWLVLPPLDVNYVMAVNMYQSDFLLPPWQRNYTTPTITADTTITFYTYEKDYYYNTPEEGAIKVEVEGILTRGIQEKRVRYKNEKGVYGLWVDEQGVPQKDLIKGKNFVIANLDEFVRDTDVAPYVTFNTDQYKLEYPKKYRVYIDPIKGGNNNTYGLLHGNLYDITAKINKAPEIPEEEEEILVDLEYKVSNWVGKNVDLPVFE